MAHIARSGAAALVLAVGLAAAPAEGQPTTTDSSVFYSLSWTELDLDYLPVPAPDGVLDRGERALLQLTVSFTNQNAIGAFSPPAQGHSTGTIRGFGSGFIDLNGTGDARGEWNTEQWRGFGVTLDWDLTGIGNGNPANNGASLQSLQFGQFPQFAFQIVTANPIEAIWTGVWTPNSYEPRAVEFQAAPNILSQATHSIVLIKTTTTQYIAAYCPATFGAVSIPVIPAPPSGLGLTGVLWFTLRRRRPSTIG